ncbi:MAG: ribosome biogenesis GTPase YlqF [Clostridiaceae bacterium]|nr:ribosome biogenesis GTPase YlqF [Clostridiaceae bacterium]
MNINWYPGHMLKARRLIAENLKLVDAVIEIIDSRIPLSSRNPDIDEIIGSKPRIIVLNKCDLADSAATKKWIGFFNNSGMQAVAVDSITGKGLDGVRRGGDSVLSEKFARDIKKGIKKQQPKLMIVGVPNVGKSSFINKFAGRASSQVQDRPGITKTKQWISIKGGYHLLDTPGILWPKFDAKTGINLAFTGAIRDQVFDIIEVAFGLCSFLAQTYPDSIINRYKLSDELNVDGHEILAQIGIRRGLLVSGGEIDLMRAAETLLDEFRAGKLGRITLEHI